MNNYKLLRPLLTLLQTRSLTVSAQQLSVTQSAMSRTLTQIRSAFNDPILIREGKQFIISAKGEDLLIQLPAILETLDALYSEDTFSPLNSSREFTFAYNAFLGDAVVPILAKDISNQAPCASLYCQLWQEENIQKLSESNIELVAATLDYFPDNIYGKKLLDEQYVIIMASSHPLANTLISQQDYFESKHILVHGMREMKQHVKEQFQRHHKKRTVLAKTPSFASAIELMCQIDALITAPLHIAGQYAQNQSITVKPLPFTLPCHSYYLLWHSKHQKDLAHRWFREQCFMLLQRHLQTMSQEGHQLLNQ